MIKLMLLRLKEVKTLPFICIVAILLFSWGCPLNRLNSLATVDDQAITLTDLALRLALLPGFSQERKAYREQSVLPVLESLIDDRILTIEARASHIEVSEEQIDHAIRQHEALLGASLLQIFTRQRGLSKKTLRRFYKDQILATEFLKQIQIKERPFCSGFVVQSSENCIKRQDFTKRMRDKHRVYIDHKALASALAEILESSR